jgi:AraC family transcriptional regulator
MTSTELSSRAEYARRMNRVLNYIDLHLDQPLELAQLADVANFSRFHFHRIFAAWMGETLGDYARRRRLEKAAFLLASTSDSVLETALATGFGSGEAFARAFKSRFGCTPSAWRADTATRLAQQAATIGQRGQSNPDQVFGNHDQEGPLRFKDDGDSTHFKGIAMEVQVLDLPAARVAYQRLIGPYGPAIGTFWRGTMAPWMQAHGLVGSTCYGVGYDDPSITPPDKCRYDACVEVAPDFLPGQQADIMTLPGGRYAVARFKAQPLAIAEAWMWLTREWLPSSGLQCDDRPCFERFDATTGMNPATGEFTCDICIPVRAL